MSLSSLYFRGCFSELSDDQKEAIEDAGGIGDVVDRSCSREDVNTCGSEYDPNVNAEVKITLERLLAQYSFYDTQKGLYSSWGNIDFPWRINNSTPNLIITATDDKWGVASYRGLVAYAEGTRVLLVEDDGYRITLYEANQDILTVTKAFDPSKWDKICHIQTTVPAGIPSIEELLERYRPYKLELFDDEWSTYSAAWSDDSLEQARSSCIGPSVTVVEAEKCLKDSSSDRWSEARVRRQFFYREGDIVLVEGACGDALCVYIAIQNIPATEQIFLSRAQFDHSDPAWQRMYCVSTGRNRCLEYQRKKEPTLGYDVVEIGSKGHFVEVPVPYRLKSSTPSLDERAGLTTPPKVLTQEEIDALPQPE